MSASIACLSCNGGTVTSGGGPATRLLVATIDGIRVFDRDSPQADWQSGETWLAGRHVSALLREPRSGRLLAGVHRDGGLWASDDGGATWQRSDDGIASSHIYTLAAQQRGDATVLFAGTEPPALYRSDDLGRSWRPLAALTDVPGTEKWSFPPPPHIAHVKNVSFHPAEPGTLYVCIEQGALLKSVDDGASWFEEAGYGSADDKFYNDNHRLLVRPSNARELFMCGGEGLYYSADAGRSWKHLTRRDARVGYPDAMFIDPRDEQVLYMAGPRHAPRQWGADGLADPTVLVSPDSGRHWEEMRVGLPAKIIGNIEAMGLHHSPDGVMLFAGTATGEVFACRDAGEPWYAVADGLPPISKGGHYRWFLSPAEREAVEQRLGGGR